MQINSISLFETKESKEKAATVIVPTVISAGTAAIASSIPKNSNLPDTVKIGLKTKASRAAKAGIISAAAMAILINKDKLVEIAKNLKENFANNKVKEEAVVEDRPSITEIKSPEQNPMQQAAVQGQNPQDAMKKALGLN